MTPQEISKLIAADLEQVEHQLSGYCKSEIHLIEKVGRDIQSSGGKRIRPALLLLSSQMCGYTGSVCHRLGAVVELIHAATLVHDDIVDDSKVRRGRSSVNARWGNEISVLIGDWLYMTSFTIALGERHFKILDILADVTRKMVEGELMQLGFNGSFDITEEQHLDISIRKTACLFAACSQIGGILGGVSEDQIELLRLFGLKVGIAFQMVDDVLDFTATETTLGKPVGSDLKEGKLTLPLIYLMRNGQPRHREMVKTVLQENGFRTVKKEAILQLVQQYCTLDRVMDQARNYVQQAQQHLSTFPPGLAREALVAVSDYIVSRDR